MPARSRRGSFFADVNRAEIIDEIRAPDEFAVARVETLELAFCRLEINAVAIRERTTFLDGLMSLPTLGIWSPRSTTYFCRAPRPATVQP